MDENNKQPYGSVSAGVLNTVDQPNSSDQSGSKPETPLDPSTVNTPSCETPPFSPDGEVRAKYFGQSRSVRTFLIVLASVWLLTMTVQYAVLLMQPPSSLPVTELAGSATFLIDINRATWVEWMQLEGIGPSMAHRIVADRTLNGPYESVDQLRRITGFGPLMLDRIRPWLTIHHEQNSARSESEQSRNTSQEPQTP